MFLETHNPKTDQGGNRKPNMPIRGKEIETVINNRTKALVQMTSLMSFFKPSKRLTTLNSSKILKIDEFFQTASVKPTLY